MNRPARAALVLVLIAVTLAIGYWAGSRRHSGTSAPVQRAAPAAPAARAPLYYRNPMGLPDTSPTPKKDAMGMDYIPVYADVAADDPGVVKVSPERVQTLGVKTALAEEKALEAGVRAVGRVEINERAIREVAPRFDGWIERLYVNATGDPVHKGQPLFSVYSPDLVSTYKELGIARELQQRTQEGDPAARERAEKLAGATQERLKNWGIAAGATQTDPSHVVFTSPADGIVLEKQAVAGMEFTAGTTVYRIADLSTVWVIADVYEQDLDRIKVGQTATIGIDAFPDRHFTARLAYLYPTLNAPTRTTQVRFELPNPDRLLRPGMFAHVELSTGGPRSRLAVPASALIDTGSRQIVLLALDAGRFKPQPVKVGLRSGDFVEILDGLKAGDRVVVSASFLIDAESNLKEALGNFTAPVTAPPAPPTNVFHAVGTLDSIDAKAGSVTITHQPIRALKWPGMTMDFDLASAEVAKGLAPGTPIRFDFEQRGPGEFVITHIEPSSAANSASHGMP